MKLALLAAAAPAVVILSVVESSPTAEILAAVAAIASAVGLGGLIKLSMKAQRDREERADKRLEDVLDTAAAERAKDREKDREERLAAAEREERHRDRVDERQVELVEEMRGLRSDVKSGAGCRATV